MDLDELCPPDENAKGREQKNGPVIILSELAKEIAQRFFTREYFHSNNSENSKINLNSFPFNGFPVALGEFFLNA